MTNLMSQIDMDKFCCQQFTVPPLLPNILKEYTNGAIKTQPRDLLLWSGAYFRAMANGEVPPIKDKLEHPGGDIPAGLSRGLLRVLHKQLGKKKSVNVTELKVKWSGLCLAESELDRLVQGKLDPAGFIEWIPFMALAARSISTDIDQAMEVVCSVLTAKVDDGTDIEFAIFAQVYRYLADVSNPKIPTEQVERVLAQLRDVSVKNSNLVGPTDFANGRVLLH